MWEYNHTDELYHHGVKGMKWGVRRTKAQLGHKVSRGLKKTKKRIVDAIQNRKAKSAVKKEASKSAREMTDAELREKANRLRLERDVLDLERQIANLSPKKVSAGEKFVKTVGSTIGPALVNVGKDYVSKALRDYMGLNDKKVDPLSDLKKSVEKLELQNREANARKGLAITEDFFASREKKKKENS